MGRGRRDGYLEVYRVGVEKGIYWKMGGRCISRHKGREKP